MEPKSLYDIVAARLAELEISENAASLAASGNRNRDVVRKLKTTNRLPSAANAEGLARVLGWQVSDLIKAAETGREPAMIGGSAVSAPIKNFDPSGLPADVPVLGTAAGSVVGAFVIDGPIDWVKRPPALANAKNLYALYVAGESMVPRFSPGDLIFVSPDRPANSGDVVVIQTRTHESAPIQSWIKILIQRREGEVVAQQINPSAEIRFRADQVVGVHRVLTMREMFGA